MKRFLDDNFLLQSKIAELLYHDFAAQMPIIDYHNHLPPRDIAQDRKFKNITQAWLEGDHYKWRAMRSNGIAEKYCTGGASDAEKFEKWAETVPYTLRNPLYHWTHLELKRYFGIEAILNPKSSQKIYEEASTKLQQADFSTRKLLEKMKVEVLCTTDDPVDDLEYHQAIQKEGISFKVFPTFRPDKSILGIENTQFFNQYLNRLSEVSGIEIRKLNDLKDALTNRADFFHQLGCRLSDHGLEYIPYAQRH